MSWTFTISFRNKCTSFYSDITEIHSTNLALSSTIVWNEPLRNWLRLPISRALWSSGDIAIDAFKLIQPFKISDLVTQPVVSTLSCQAILQSTENIIDFIFTSLLSCKLILHLIVSCLPQMKVTLVSRFMPLISQLLLLMGYVFAPNTDMLQANWNRSDF